MTRRYYAVLAKVSLCYSPLEGRLVTCYSPVRHCTQGLLPFLVRLACVRHAASVDSEPGSNSRLKLFASPDDGGHRGLTAPPIKGRNPEPNGDLPCEKIQAKAACSLTTGTFNLLSKILTTLRLSGAVWIEGWIGYQLSSNLCAARVRFRVCLPLAPQPDYRMIKLLSTTDLFFP